MRALFVTNGHGEAAIADRIATELRAVAPLGTIDHLALVSAPASRAMREVGPRADMPSGGLIAMGNLRNIARDIRAGLLRLTWRQVRFLRSARNSHDVVIAVGDAYALALALLARRPTVFVGTAKSAAVAPYGTFEEILLRRAAASFVRDAPTADRLRGHGVPALAANAIADLYEARDDPEAERAFHDFVPAVALFPGSRESAYGDATFLLEVVGEMARAVPGFGAVLSVARGLDPRRFAEEAQRAGWDLARTGDEAIPFVLSRNGREIVRAWSRELGPLLARVVTVLGQAGTANEAAAAAGVPIVAFERNVDRKSGWYRRRQRGLLGDALIVAPASLPEAVEVVRALLSDSARRERMGRAGRAQMGEPGAARKIASCIASLAPAT
jgi:uncharacterized protein (TIGR03492 family)